MRFFVRMMGAAAVAATIVSCGGGGGSTITGTTGGSGGSSGGTGGTGNNITCTTATFCLGADQFIPSTATVARNTEVIWSNNSGITHNVTFANPSAALSFGGGSAGNITDWSSGTRSRTFSAPGTYTFQCTIHAGMTGTLTVQ